MIRRGRQRGVALITALLAVAIVTVLAVELTRQQHFDIRRTQNLLGRDQAAVYQQAVEQWALTILAEDARRTETDHRGEPWAEAIEPPPFQGAQMRLQLFDLQGRFNLNNLVTRPGSNNAPAVRRMTRLLAGLEAETGIVQATADWIDPESGTRYPDGAGDDWYSRLDPPYRSANRPMAS
ncbi:MAG: type II secretion system minor pseudopilin GspK, partial [Ectothiorhodospiraceae bacterium]